MAARLAGAGAGASRYTIAQNAQMNVTPFVDVMMVLLIIFMVAVPLATTKIDLDMPPAPTVPVAVQEPIYISVEESGLFIGNQPTTRETLVRDLKSRIGPGARPADAGIYVRGDADIPYDDFMAVMSTLKSNKFDKIGLINEDIR